MLPHSRVICPPPTILPNKVNLLEVCVIGLPYFLDYFEMLQNQYFHSYSSLAVAKFFQN